MILYFVPEKLPRTMTKAQWKEADRWRRIVDKKLQQHLIGKMELLTQQIIFGTMPKESMGRLLDDVVNPALLLGPGM